jgi:DNA adenine methylase
MQSTPSRPVLRYYGGKWRLAPWIISHFPAHRVYVEPFGGAASVLMRKPRSHAEVYNDLDGEIANVFRVLRDRQLAAALREAVRLTPFARSEYLAAYLPAHDSVEQARRTLVKAWMGYGSGGLVESSAGFRVALSMRRHTAKEWAGYARHIDDFAERLAGVFIESRPASALMAQYDEPDALWFLDPPYLGETRGARHRYRHDFTEADHIALAEQARALRGRVILSGYASPLYDELYAGWTTRSRPARDALSQQRTEVLWLNPACAEALQPSLLGGAA